MAGTDQDAIASAETGLVDVSSMTPRELRAVMQWLGYEPPASLSPADLAAATSVAQALPSDVLAAALSPGVQVNFAAPMGGVGIPGVLPVSGGQNFEGGAEVALSDVRTGPGGERNQVLEMSVEMQSQIGAAYGRTDLNRIYGYAERFGALPEGIRNTVDGWSRPAQWAVRGPEFRGTLSAEVFSGGRLSYEAVVPPELGARIAQGDLNIAPNPLEPMSIPVGSTVVMRGEALQGTTFAASYRLLRGTETLAELNGQAFGVRRVDDRIVEVTTGPSQAVERDAYLGLGLAVANIGIGTEYRSSNDLLSVAHMDLDTVEGQEAYRQFMQAGVVPDRAGPGVPMAGERQQSERQGQRGVQANIGPVEWSRTMSEWRKERTETRWSDGASELVVSESLARTAGHYEIASQTRADGNGGDTDVARQVTFVGVDGAIADYTRTAFSGKYYNGDIDSDDRMPSDAIVDLRFTDGDLMHIRDLAREYLGENNPDALRRIDAAADQPNNYSLGPDTLIFMEMAAAAQTPDEVFDYFLTKAQASSSDHLLSDLNRLSINTTRDGLPGEVTIRDSDMTILFEHARPVQQAQGADPRRADDPDHDLYRQALGAVEQLDPVTYSAAADSGRALAASATLLARQHDMQIDHVILTPEARDGGGANMIVVDGGLRDPAHRLAVMPATTALNTPEENSFAALEQLRDQARLTAEQEQQRSLQQDQILPASPGIQR